MLTLHLPKRFDPLSESLKKTDPTAWRVLGIATCLLLVVLGTIFYR
jgi:hypothetical protein